MPRGLPRAPGRCRRGNGVDQEGARTGAKNVDKPADRPRTATFFTLRARNVEHPRPGRGNLDVFALARAPSQCKPYDHAPRQPPTRAAPSPPSARRRARAPGLHADRLLPVLRGARPARAVHQARRPRAPVSSACGSPTTTTRGTTSRAEPVRLVRHRRALAGDRARAGHHRRDLPDRPHPPGADRAGRRDRGGDAAGRFALGVGSGEALNEHILGDAWPRGRHSPRDARGGDRDDPRAVDRRRSEPPRQALHGRERAHLHAAGRAAADHHLGLRAEGHRPRGAHRRRLRHDRARQA